MYHDRPVAFVKDVFGVQLDPWQQLALNNLAGNQKVAIAGCTGVGKDFMAACAVWWYLSTRDYPKVICTAVKQETLRDNLWAELSMLMRKSPLMQAMFEYGMEKIYRKGAPEEWFAVARTASKRYGGGGEAQAEGLAGKYSHSTLALIDEASGVDDANIQALEGCHDDQTEVLTDQGWMYFKDIPLCAKQPKILSMDPDTLEADYQDFNEYHEYDHDGEMYLYEERGCNFKVTPNHKFLYKHCKHYPNWQYREIQEVTGTRMRIPRTFKWKGQDHDKIHLVNFKVPGGVSSYDAKDFFELIGWYLSEGYVCDYSLGISQSEAHEPENIKRISTLLDRLSIEYSYNGKDFHLLESAHLRNFFKKMGHGALNKKIPELVMGSSPRLIQSFLDGFFLGDGNQHGNNRRYFTSSEVMADQLQILCMKVGSYGTKQVHVKAGTKAVINGKETQSHADCFRITQTAPTTTRTHSTVRTDRMEKVEYSGKVYCLTVPPYHLMYTRRGGVCMWSGNSANTPNRKMLMIGNPLRRTGYFAKVFLDQRYAEGWTTQNVSYLDSTRTSDPENAKIRQRWIEMYGMESAYVQARVFGQFPSSSTVDTIFTRDEIQEAVDRNEEMKDDPKLPICIGIDVARYGDDETVYYVRRGPKTLDMVCEAQSTGPQVEGRAVFLAEKYCPKGQDPRELVEFRIDETGLGGHGAVDHLREEGWQVAGVHNGSKTILEEDYKSLGDELWMEDGKDAVAWCGLYPDDILISQLESRTYTFTGKAKQRRLSTKDEMRRQGHGSPDRADAFILAFAKRENLEYAPTSVDSLRKTISFL